MQLLFVLSAKHHADELLGMAQLSAAFGQQVHLWHPKDALDAAQIAACHEAGIAELACDNSVLRQWLASAERVVRL